QYVPGQDSWVDGVGKDPSGNIYAAGVGFVDSTNLFTHGLVMKSADGGTTWQLSDDLGNGESNPGYETHAITSDAAGIVYAVADNWWTADPYHWIIRRSFDAGASW